MTDSKEPEVVRNVKLKLTKAEIAELNQRARDMFSHTNAVSKLMTELARQYLSKSRKAKPPPAPPSSRRHRAPIGDERM